MELTRVWASDPYGSGQVELVYDSDGPYVEITHEGVGSMRARFSCNPDHLRRFFRDGHALLGDP